MAYIIAYIPNSHLSLSSTRKDPHKGLIKVLNTSNSLTTNLVFFPHFGRGFVFSMLISNYLLRFRQWSSAPLRSQTLFPFHLSTRRACFPYDAGVATLNFLVLMTEKTIFKQQYFYFYLRFRTSSWLFGLLGYQLYPNLLI